MRMTKRKAFDTEYADKYLPQMLLLNVSVLKSIIR